MDRLFVDTGAWCAFFNRADPRQGAVAQVLQEWQERLVTTDYIFDELVTLLRKRVGHKTALLAGKALRSGDLSDWISTEASDLSAAWQQFMRDSDKAYSFTDCASFAVMRRLRIVRAASVDAEFRQAGFQVLPDLGSGGGR